MRYSHCFGKKSSRILLGTAYFGDTISKETAFEMMDKFREMGGTHIDTARYYADGASEAVVGEWLSLRGANEMLVSTKGGYYDPDSGEKGRINVADVSSDLEKSLKALNVETIDFYWLHRDDETKPVEEIIDFMNRFVKEGKIKKFGASNWTSQRISEANEYAHKNGLMGFAASQIRFNPAYCLGERGGLVGMDEKEFMFYKNSNMPVVAYSSQAKGFFSKMSESGADSLSEKAKKRYLCDENLSRLKVLERLSKKYDASIAAVICGAMSSFDIPEVFPVIGGSRLGQIADSLNGSDVIIEKNELEEIFKFEL
ncbi:MAG: aldo/keto reductase [Clostridia bacterium]|nr:aldo/keto reductase [Clostridia bacterium]